MDHAKEHGNDEDLIRGWIHAKRPVRTIARLPGDASTRHYYRVETAVGSFVAMKMEPFPNEAETLPFLVVGKHLEESGVSVPRVFEVDAAQGYLLLEDLGDITLLRRLQEVDDEAFERTLYEDVLDSLVRLQLGSSPEKARAKIPSFDLRFDFEKLMWEVHFAIEHFYEGHLQRKISPPDRKILEDGFGQICGILDREPTVFTHRDFHSRNLMVSPNPGPDGREHMVMIDFQDARMGPAQYDLVSLLRDSYYQLSEKQVAHLIDYYIARRQALSGEKIDRDRFMEIFDLMAVQRNFKAIGSFASFHNKRGISTYLKYIGNTFENIRRTLLRHPEYARLREVLFHYYYF